MSDKIKKLDLDIDQLKKDLTHVFDVTSSYILSSKIEEIEDKLNEIIEFFNSK